MSDQPQQTNGFLTLLIGVVMYTALGCAAGVLWIFGAGAMGFQSIGILPILALWWAWLLVWLPPIVVGVAMFRATDPLAQMAKNLDKVTKGSNT